MRDLTCIYYTHNRERSKFETKIQRSLWRSLNKAGVELISVSQKPMDFGKNICVGNIGISSQNAWRQFQIGAIESKTKFVCTAESDFLYPIEYFQFDPPNDKTIYLAVPMYVLMAMRKKVKVFIPKKRGSWGAMIAGRERVIEAVGKTIDQLGKWGNIDERDFNFPNIFEYMNTEHFKVSTPIISFKTDNGLHRGTPKWKPVLREIPGVVSAAALIRKYL